MARWKARVEFLLSLIGLLFRALTVEALQDKRRHGSLLTFWRFTNRIIIKIRCYQEG